MKDILSVFALLTVFNIQIIFATQILGQIITSNEVIEKFFLTFRSLSKFGLTQSNLFCNVGISRIDNSAYIWGIEDISGKFKFTEVIDNWRSSAIYSDLSDDESKAESFYFYRNQWSIVTSNNLHSNLFKIGSPTSQIFRSF